MWAIIYSKVMDIRKEDSERQNYCTKQYSKSNDSFVGIFTELTYGTKFYFPQVWRLNTDISHLLWELESKDIY